MKKAALYIFSLSCLLVYVLSLNRQFMEWWADFRTYQLHAPYAKARYGDLYSNCFLPGYLDTAFMPLKNYKNDAQKTDLYLIHDSYLADKVRKENFQGIRRLAMSDLRQGEIHVSLDPVQKNVMLIEFSERAAEWRLTDTSLLFSKIKLQRPDPFVSGDSDDTPVLNYLFNPNINQNLEFALYDYEYFIPIKNLKAQINYSLFKRLPHDVSISTDEQYLLLSETVNPVSYASSFFARSPDYHNYVLYCADRIVSHFKGLGFDEVYFSVVPNPVSIVDEKRMSYNHKVELLEEHPLQGAAYISVYKLFKESKRRVYRTDDSHWNGRGIQIWVDEVNKRIAP